MNAHIRIGLLSLMLPAVVAACKGNEAAAKSMDVEVSSAGEAQVTLKDERGHTMATRDVTGKIEFDDGHVVSLTPGADGKTLRATMGGHMGDDPAHCMANVRVNVNGGAEHTKQLDLCSEHKRHGGTMGGGHHDRMGPGHGVTSGGR